MFLRSLFAELPRLTAHSQPVFADISTIDVKTYGGVAQMLWQWRAGENGGRLQTLREDELANYWLNTAKID